MACCVWPAIAAAAATRSGQAPPSASRSASTRARTSLISPLVARIPRASWRPPPTTTCAAARQRRRRASRRPGRWRARCCTAASHDSATYPRATTARRTLGVGAADAHEVANRHHAVRRRHGRGRGPARRARRSRSGRPPARAAAARRRPRVRDSARSRAAAGRRAAPRPRARSGDPLRGSRRPRRAARRARWPGPAARARRR